MKWSGPLGPPPLLVKIAPDLTSDDMEGARVLAACMCRPIAVSKKPAVLAACACPPCHAACHQASKPADLHPQTLRRWRLRRELTA